MLIADTVYGAHKVPVERIPTHILVRMVDTDPEAKAELDRRFPDTQSAAQTINIVLDSVKSLLPKGFEHKIIRRVRDSAFWHAPVGTIITPGMMAERAAGERVPSTPGEQRIGPRTYFPPLKSGKPYQYKTDDASMMKNISEEDREKQHTGLQDVFGLTYDDLVANLETLYQHAVESGALEVGSQWYEDAGNISAVHAKSLGLSREQGCAVVAALSPRTEWDVNIAWARYVMDVIVENPTIPDLTRTYEKDTGVYVKGKRHKFMETLTAYDFAKREFDHKGLGSVDDCIGKPLDTLTEPQQAVLIRIMSQAGYYTSDGKSLAYVAIDRNGNPKKRRLAVSNGDDAVVKAMKIVRADPQDVPAVIDEWLRGMKVRSFYNNLSIGTTNGHEDITIDTHALSAACNHRYMASSDEAGRFNGGPPSSKPYGFKGMYPIFADAFREVSHLHDVHPIHMQAALWLQWRHENERSMPIITHSSMVTFDAALKDET